MSAMFASTFGYLLWCGAMACPTSDACPAAAVAPSPRHDGRPADRFMPSPRLAGPKAQTRWRADRLPVPAASVNFVQEGRADDVSPEPVQPPATPPSMSRRAVPGQPPTPAPDQRIGRVPPGWDAIIERIARKRPEVADRLCRFAAESPDRLDELLAGSVLDHLFIRMIELQPDTPGAPTPETRRPYAVNPTGPGPTPRPSAYPPRGAPLPGGAPRDAGPGTPRPRFAPRFDPPRRQPGQTQYLRQQADYSDLVQRLVEAGRDDDDLARRAEEAAAAARAAGERAESDPLRADAEELLRETVRHQFDVRTQRRALELERIQREIERLSAAIEEVRRELKEREADRDEIIRTRISELLRRGQGAR